MTLTKTLRVIRLANLVLQVKKLDFLGFKNLSYLRVHGARGDERFLYDPALDLRGISYIPVKIW